MFPAVSAEGAAFWIVRTSPVPLRVVPVVEVLDRPRARSCVLAEALTIARTSCSASARSSSACSAPSAIVFMTFALVGLACGMGARYPRFSAENLTQVAGSYGGVAFMVAGRAVHPGRRRASWPGRPRSTSGTSYRGLPIPAAPGVADGRLLAAAAALSVAHVLARHAPRHPRPRGAGLSLRLAARQGLCYDRGSSMMKRNPTRTVRIGTISLGAGPPRGRPEHVRDPHPGRRRDRRAGRGDPRAPAARSCASRSTARRTSRPSRRSAGRRPPTSWSTCRRTIASPRASRPHVDKVRYNPGHL